VNTKEIQLELKNRLGLGEKEVVAMFDAAVGAMTKELLDGNSVALQGFGLLEVRKKEERISVNPSTKQRMLIPPKLSLAFKPSVTLKDKYKEFK
jgi:DNA-binding protein HU-beta